MGKWLGGGTSGALSEICATARSITHFQELLCVAAIWRFLARYQLDDDYKELCFWDRYTYVVPIYVHHVFNMKLTDF